MLEMPFHRLPTDWTVGSSEGSHVSCYDKGGKRVNLGE